MPRCSCSPSGSESMLAPGAPRSGPPSAAMLAAGAVGVAPRSCRCLLPTLLHPSWAALREVEGSRNVGTGGGSGGGSSGSSGQSAALVWRHADEAWSATGPLQAHSLRTSAAGRVGPALTPLAHPLPQQPAESASASRFARHGSCTGAHCTCAAKRRGRRLLLATNCATDLCDPDKEFWPQGKDRPRTPWHRMRPAPADRQPLHTGQITPCFRGAGEWAVAAATRLNSSTRGCSTSWWPGMRCNTT